MELKEKTEFLIFPAVTAFLTDFSNFQSLIMYEILIFHHIFQRWPSISSSRQHHVTCLEKSTESLVSANLFINFLFLFFKSQSSQVHVGTASCIWKSEQQS